jgi:hypothetical protein
MYRLATTMTPTLQNLPRLFAVLWLFVIFVSVFDAYLVLEHRYLLPEFEQNPLGLALIKLNDGQVWYLLTVKLIGTIAAGSLILLTYNRSRRIGLTVTVLIAGVQLWLLVYLLLT